MRKTYWISIGIVLLLGVGVLVLPPRTYQEEVSADKILTEITDGTRYYSNDEVAAMIIDQDPSFILVDVRSMYDFVDFSLPGAINIPLDELLLPDWDDYFNQRAQKLIFYSNGSILAEKAWLLAQRLGYEHTYIMKGGLNAWIEDIIRPTPPPETASEEDFQKYQFRLGASRFFGGGMEVQSDIQAEPIVIERKQKKNVIEGGC